MNRSLPTRLTPGKHFRKRLTWTLHGALRKKTPQEATSGWLGVCLLINLVFSSTGSRGGSQMGIEQGDKVTRTVRRTNLEPRRGG